MKIRMLPSVNVICLRIDCKLIPIIIMNKRRERMYWEGGGKIFKLKNNFLQETTSTTYNGSNNLLLQPEYLYTV